MPFRRQYEGGDLCAIFVHAGAGYHSTANEKYHLGAVNDAAKIAMAILKNGGSAVDAVEMALRLLEDREITNAGYGSNLTIEGEVECDATMVDHFGRSGAVGAVSQIKNPIALARLVLEESTKPLSLQRVPPNLLVGSGAVDFAADYGMPIMPPDYLISDSARERWSRWKQDLISAKEKELRSPRVKPEIDWTAPNRASHSCNTAFSPPQSPTDQKGVASALSGMATATGLPFASTVDVPAAMGDDYVLDGSPGPTFTSTTGVLVQTPNMTPNSWIDHPDTAIDDTLHWIATPAKRQRLDGSFEESDIVDDYYGTELNSQGNADQAAMDSKEDDITDTVGAIAIDCFGNIAAGSSSGGIGMKHKGRCGPAALVGVGTAVIPIDPREVDRTCVATVTSGTGEHMATTTAAARAAERVYSAVRKERGQLLSCTEDEAINSVISQDFMNHPGVRNSCCAAAIGILSVKKTKDGIWFYFAHNTDSFALASMHSEERKPVCTMSRSRGNGSIAQGGRASRCRRASKH